MLLLLLLLLVAGVVAVHLFQATTAGTVCLDPLQVTAGWESFEILVRPEVRPSEDPTT